MKWSLYLISLLAGSSVLFYQSQLPNNPPTHFVLDKEWQQVSKSEPVFVFRNPDTTIEHQMQLLMNEDGLPLLYYADIQTPVCIDGLCKPVYVEMYWDLLGQYAGYGVYPDQLLTKYDHDLFEAKDHLTLHQLLLDQSSVLGRRKLTQLYDTKTSRTESIKFKGIEVDGISGATKKEIKASIVEGGLYSCYKLWHLAYGEATEKMRSQLSTIYSDTLANYFLSSRHKDYQFYAVKKLKPTDFLEKIAYIVPIVKVGKPLTRAYILKKMPKKLFQNSLVVNEWYQHFSDFDFNAKTLLVNNLQYSNSAAALFLSKQLTNLSKNQLKTFLVSVDKIQALEVVQENLTTFSKDANAPHNYLVKVFLKTHKGE